MKKLQVLLLAGGESTRFFPFANKTLIPFFGKSFLAWHYEQCLRLGIEDVIVVTNETIDEKLKHVAVPKGLQVSYALQKGKGQGQAVIAASPFFKDNAVVILNASDFYSDDFLSPFLKNVPSSDEDIHLGAVRVTAYFPGGYLKLAGDGHVTEIVEKPEAGKEPSDIVRILTDYIAKPKEFVAMLRKTENNPAYGYEAAINAMIEAGASCGVSVVPHDSWVPIKYPWDILSVWDRMTYGLEKNIDPTVQIGEHVVIEGPVVIEAGVRIMEFTKIVGPVYIGKNTIIGNNSMIRSSMIGALCIVGYACDITRSVIGNDCWFHSNYVGDSVLGNNVSMGSGTVLANLRLDDGVIKSKVKDQKISTHRNKLGALIGNDVRIGVQASVMPGIKIGSGSCIGAGIVVSEDIPESTFCVLKKQDLVLEKNRIQRTTSREAFRKDI